MYNINFYEKKRFYFPLYFNSSISSDLIYQGEKLGNGLNLKSKLEFILFNLKIGFEIQSIGNNKDDIFKIYTNIYKNLNKNFRINIMYEYEKFTNSKKSNNNIILDCDFNNSFENKLTFEINKNKYINTVKFNFGNLINFKDLKLSYTTNNNNKLNYGQIESKFLLFDYDICLNMCKQTNKSERFLHNFAIEFDNFIYY